MLLVSKDKARLKRAVFEIKEYLLKENLLTLHPKKIYLQHFTKGINYLGVIIKPYRKYLSRRIKNNFYCALFQSKMGLKTKESILSYLGIMKHCNCYNLKKKNWENLTLRYL